MHGNRSQPQRTQALADFKSGRTRILVATDIAARGIDVEGLSHVVNFDVPNVPEDYIHRVGRTARAGQTGDAPVPLSQVRQRVRPRSHSSATRIAEVLAEMGLLHDDTTAAIRTWIDRRSG